MTTDQDRFTERLKRYAKVATKMSGAAARLAGHHYLGLDLDTRQHAADLRRILGELKGPLIKIAQLLATIPEALPEDYMQELRQLQSQAPPMGWAFVKRRMIGELGAGWQAKFSHFERTAVAAASLGQVHYARALNGAELACKLQYPDMQSTIEADLRQMGFLLKIYESYDATLTTDNIREEISARLKEELDYKREARHINLFRSILSGEPSIHIPRVLSDLSTSRLLTMEWLEGKPLLEALSLSQQERNNIARTLFRAWYLPFYHYGILHGDPHLGNYSIHNDGSINLLDFGCVRIFNPAFIKGVIDLYSALQHQNMDLALEAYRGWGFSNLSTEMVHILNQWAQYLYGPLLENTVRPIDPNYNANQGREIAGRVYQELRRLGGIKPPREFVFMDRAAVGLGSAFMHLRAELNWHQEFHSLIEGFEVQKLARQQQKILESIGLNE